MMPLYLLLDDLTVIFPQEKYCSTKYFWFNGYNSNKSVLWNIIAFVIWSPNNYRFRTSRNDYRFVIWIEMGLNRLYSIFCFVIRRWKICLNHKSIWWICASSKKMTALYTPTLLKFLTLDVMFIKISFFPFGLFCKEYIQSFTKRIILIFSVWSLYWLKMMYIGRSLDILTHSSFRFDRIWTKKLEDLRSRKQ